MSLTPQQVPYTGPKGSDSTKHDSNAPTIEALKRAMVRMDYLDKPLSELDGKWGAGSQFDKAFGEWSIDVGLSNDHTYGEKKWDKIRAAKVMHGGHQGEYALDEYAQRLIRDEDTAGKVPDLGPVFSGGKKLTAHDLTHATSGIPLFPAFDDAFSQGKTIIAPEDLEVYQASSSNPGDACYCKGKSGLRYWFGHLTTAPAVGTKIKKGAKVGVTCVNNIGGGPHVHVGVNVEKFPGWGAGKQLKHHTNYTHGAPTIGEQLKAGPS